MLSTAQETQPELSGTRRRDATRRDESTTISRLSGIRGREAFDSTSPTSIIVYNNISIYTHTPLSISLTQLRTSSSGTASPPLLFSLVANAPTNKFHATLIVFHSASSKISSATVSCHSPCTSATRSRSFAEGRYERASVWLAGRLRISLREAEAEGAWRVGRREERRIEGEAR